jgi:hypothetical protein
MKKAWKWLYRVKSGVIFNKGQFTHICQLNASCGQDSVSGIVRRNVTLQHFRKVDTTTTFCCPNLL